MARAVCKRNGVQYVFLRKTGDLRPKKGLFLENGKSCKFLKVSPTLQGRPRKGQRKHWNSTAWPGEPSAVSYGPMRCLLWIIINFEAIFLAEKCQFWPILVEMGPKGNLILICSCIFCTQPEPYLYCAPVCNTGPQPVLFASQGG